MCVGVCVCVCVGVQVGEQEQVREMVSTSKRVTVRVGECILVQVDLAITPFKTSASALRWLVVS